MPVDNDVRARPAPPEASSRPAIVREGIPRPVEAIIAALGLAATAPLIAVTALAVAVASRGPILFRQERVGRNGRSFILFKFRTMIVGQGGAQVTARGDTRVTSIGRFLRRTKLDELPELYNVLKGEMSLVGPRPEVPRYVDLQDSRWQIVLRARPGITDPVTMRLRNEEALLAEIEGDREKFYRENLQPFKLAGYQAYLSRRSWWQDVKVLRDTIVAIILPGRALPPPPGELCPEQGEETIHLRKAKE